MACGCGGASNVYKPPASAGAGSSSRGGLKVMPASGLPKVWNGPTVKPAIR